MSHCGGRAPTEFSEASRVICVNAARMCSNVVHALRQRVRCRGVMGSVFMVKTLSHPLTPLSDRAFNARNRCPLSSLSLFYTSMLYTRGRRVGLFRNKTSLTLISPPSVSQSSKTMRKGLLLVACYYSAPALTTLPLRFSSAGKLRSAFSFSVPWFITAQSNVNGILGIYCLEWPVLPVSPCLRRVCLRTRAMSMPRGIPMYRPLLRPCKRFFRMTFRGGSVASKPLTMTYLHTNLRPLSFRRLISTRTNTAELISMQHPWKHLDSLLRRTLLVFYGSMASRRLLFRLFLFLFMELFAFFMPV